MFRTIVAAWCGLALTCSVASADEIKGTLKKVNVGGQSLTLAVDGKDRVLAVGKDTSFVSVAAGKKKKGMPAQKETPIDGGLSALKIGANVTVVTEKSGGKETVTSVKVGGMGKGDAAKPKKKKADAKKPNAAKKVKANLTGDKTKKADKKKAKSAKKKADKKKAKADKKKAKKKDKKKNKKKGKKKKAK